MRLTQTVPSKDENQTQGAVALTTHVDAESVVRAASDTLAFARQGAEDFAEKGDRAHSGLHNAIILGRSVTFAVQNLRSFRPDFDDWYEPHQTRLANNPYAKWFLELRNRIEKQGQMGVTSVSTTARVLDRETQQRILAEGPEGTTGFFLGDRLGRSGWIVVLPDGSETRVFFKVPDEVATSTLSVDDAPDGFDLDEQLPLFLDELEHLVAAARAFIST